MVAYGKEEEEEEKNPGRHKGATEHLTWWPPVLYHIQGNTWCWSLREHTSLQA